jgi:hypothetical protein
LVLVVAALLSLPLLAPACYNPSILDGGLQCADGGKPCPDGFTCRASDRRCWAVMPSTCSVPAPAAICQDAPAAGTACNPTCQTGCACGRCNVSGAAAVCTTSIGPGKVGEICTPNKDNCAAGFICLLEADTCGANLGRCYQHCTTTAQCGTGRICNIPILDGSNKDTGYKTCSLLAQACNPTVATGNLCPSAALGCYLMTTGATVCDCPNNATSAILGGVCNVYNDCAPGLVCAAVAGTVGSHCRQGCALMGTNTCPSGPHCVAVGTTYGYCST